MDRVGLRAALAHPNVRAFLRVIRAGESRQDDSAYRMRYGGHGKPPAFFDDFSAHPKIFELRADGRKSSAAGAYQATWTTWSEELAKYGWPDFTPACQDEFAVARLIYRGALKAVIAGSLGEAFRLLKDEWTSLPGGDEANAATALATETFLRWGGTIASAAPAFDPDSLDTEHYEGPESYRYTPQPKPEAKMAFPLVPLLTAFGPKLVELIPQLGAMFGSGSDVSQRNVKALTAVVDTVVKATGEPNLQAAVERMEADPEAARAARAEVAEVMALMEVGGGIAEARKVAGDPGQAPPWRNPAVWIAAAILPLVYMVATAVLFGVGGQQFSDDIKTLLVTAVVTGALGSITGFFLGSSLGSQSKDQRSRQFQGGTR